MTTSAGPASTRSRNADATRHDLLLAAMRRFTTLGYERTRTRDIAADVGVNVSLINRYFGSKDNLFTEVMRESAQLMAHTTAVGPADLVESMMRQLDPDAWPDSGQEHPLLLLLRSGGDDERIAELRRRSLDNAVAQVTHRARAGGIPPDSATRLAGEVLLALLAGVLTLRTALPGGELATADHSRLSSLLARTTEAILHES